MKFDHQLTNSLKSDAQTFSKLTAPHRPVQNIEQPPGARTRKCATTPNSIRNSLEATISSASRETPPIHLVALGKPEFLQYFECLFCFLEIKLGSYCDISLGLFARSKCVKASFLGFGQNEIPNFAIHADSPLIRDKATLWGVERLNTATSSNDPQRDQRTQFPTVTL